MNLPRATRCQRIGILSAGSLGVIVGMTVAGLYGAVFAGALGVLVGLVAATFVAVWLDERDEEIAVQRRIAAERAEQARASNVVAFRGVHPAGSRRVGA